MRFQILIIILLNKNIKIYNRIKKNYNYRYDIIF